MQLPLVSAKLVHEGLCNHFLHVCRQAADVSNADALTHLGHMYMNIMGVQQDNKTAPHFLSIKASTMFSRLLAGRLQMWVMQMHWLTWGTCT